MTKREIVDRIREIDAAIATLPRLEEERAMLGELLAEWPDGEDALALLGGRGAGGTSGAGEDEPPDTEPGTPRTKSSRRMAAVKLPPGEPES